MRKGISVFREQGHLLFASVCEPSLAAAEASVGQIEPALTRVDDAIAEIERTGQRWYEAEMHRIRGEILLKRDPGETAAAGAAFQTAIAVAHHQKARSFELRAALALAKLYQSNDRPADAHAVLASALEGFSPTPEFPEIAQAQTLLGALTS
jgi:predicted ATPase